MCEHRTQQLTTQGAFDRRLAHPLRRRTFQSVDPFRRTPHTETPYMPPHPHHITPHHIQRTRNTV